MPKKIFENKTPIKPLNPDSSLEAHIKYAQKLISESNKTDKPNEHLDKDFYEYEENAKDLIEESIILPVTSETRIESQMLTNKLDGNDSNNENLLNTANQFISHTKNSMKSIIVEKKFKKLNNILDYASVVDAAQHLLIDKQLDFEQFVRMIFNVHSGNDEKYNARLNEYLINQIHILKYYKINTSEKLISTLHFFRSLDQISSVFHGISKLSMNNIQEDLFGFFCGTEIERIIKNINSDLEKNKENSEPIEVTNFDAKYLQQMISVENDFSEIYYFNPSENNMPNWFKTNTTKGIDKFKFFNSLVNLIKIQHGKENGLIDFIKTNKINSAANDYFAINHPKSVIGYTLLRSAFDENTGSAGCAHFLMRNDLGDCLNDIQEIKKNGFLHSAFYAATHVYEKINMLPKDFIADTVLKMDDIFYLARKICIQLRFSDVTIADEKQKKSIAKTSTLEQYGKDTNDLKKYLLI